MKSNLSNKQAVKIKRVIVPLLDTDNQIYPPPSPTSGVKYFLPDLPDLDRGFIVGIEAHLSKQDIVVPSSGDLEDISSIPGINLATVTNAGFVYVTIINHDKSEKFSNIPLKSLYPFQSIVLNFPSLFKKPVRPYIGKIKSRLCYVYIPAGTGSLGSQFCVNFSFFYLA